MPLTAPISPYTLDGYGTWTLDGLGTWTLDDLTPDVTSKPSAIFTDRENISANFQTELNKLSGATPDWKLYLLGSTFKCDTLAEWQEGNAFAFVEYGTGNIALVSNGTLGTYQSKVFNNQLNRKYKTLVQSHTLNSGTVLYHFRTGSTDIDCLTKTWIQIVSGTRPNVEDGQFCQFRTVLYRNGTFASPSVDSFTGTYYYNPNDQYSGLDKIGQISRQIERALNEFTISDISPTVVNNLGWWNQLGYYKNTVGTAIRGFDKNTTQGNCGTYELTYQYGGPGTQVLVNGTLVSLGTVSTMGTSSNIITGINIYWGTVGTNNRTEINLGVFFAGHNVYNEPIEVWKGFKYGWTGSTWGTAEYIPAFSGYIDTVQCDDISGKAVIKARDKSKLLKIKTTDNVNQTGTAGGAWWNNKSIDFLVEQAINVGANWGTNTTTTRNYTIDKTTFYGTGTSEQFILYKAGTTEIINTLYAWSYNTNEDVYYGVNGGTLYRWITEKTEAIGTADGDPEIVTYNSNDKYIYFQSGTIIRRYDGTTSDKIGTNSYVPSVARGLRFNASRNRIYEMDNLAYFDITTLASGTIGTVAQCSDGVVETSGSFAYRLKQSSGTAELWQTNLSTGVDTKIGTTTIGLPTVGDTQNTFIAYNENNGTLYGRISTVDTTYIWIHGTNTGNFQIIGTSSPTSNSYKYFLYRANNNLIYFLSYDSPATKYKLNEINGITINTLGTLAEDYIASNILSISAGTVSNVEKPSRLMFYAGSLNDMYIWQYSIENDITIGTADFGAETIQSQLQSLAEATNMVQYVGEDGKYYFKKRDPRNPIKYNFVENDLIINNILEGDSSGANPIINKAIWGTTTGTVVFEDGRTAPNSVDKYGTQVKIINNKWIINSAIAQGILKRYVMNYRDPHKILTPELRWYPTLQLIDTITLNKPSMNINPNKLWQVIKIEEDNNPPKTKLELREVI